MAEIAPRRRTTESGPPAAEVRSGRDVSGEDLVDACRFEQPQAPFLDHDRVSR
jgi:hypothetical protein